MRASLDRPVVLALHYQNEVLHPQGRMRFGAGGNAAMRERVEASAAGLLALARERRWSIVHVRIAYNPDFSDVIPNCEIFRTVVAQRIMAEGSWGAEFFSGLAPLESPREHVVTHNRVNAFFGSPLAGLLETLVPSCLVVAGVATNSVVEHTCRHACDMGYESVVVEDACGAASEDVHRAALHNLRLCGEVASLADLQSAAAQSASLQE
jgi:nicotinamidase-related amidase